MVDLTHIAPDSLLAPPVTAVLVVELQPFSDLQLISQVFRMI